MSSYISTQHINKYSRNTENSIAAIASGKKINSAKDFLEGESLINSFRVQSTALKVNLSSIKAGLSLADAADRSISHSQAILQTMRELSVQSANGIYKTRAGDSVYSPATATFQVTGGTNGTYASGSITLTGATEGSQASGSLTFSGAHAGSYASGSFSISNATDAANARGQFSVGGGAGASGDNINTITVNGVQINNNAISHTGNNNTTAAAIVTEINGSSQSGNFTASRSGSTVYITADTAGTAPNGHVVAVSTAGSASASSISNMANGLDNTQTTISSLTVNGTNVLSGTPLSVTGGNNAIATAIRSAFSSSDFSASGSGSTVIVTSNTKNSGQNGYAVRLNKSNVSGPAASSSDGSLSLSGGVTATTTTITNVTVGGGSNLIDGSGSVTVTGNGNDIATAVAARISSADYTAFRSGSSVTFLSNTKDQSQNGLAVTGSVSHVSGDNTATRTAGTLSSGDTTSTNSVSAITVNGANILAGTVNHNGGNSGTATAIKNAINSNSATSGFEASTSGARITITAKTKNTGHNGYVIAMTKANSDTFNEIAMASRTNFSGGDTPSNNAFTEIRVKGTKINANNILHTGNNATTADAIANEINNSTTNRNYTASSTGNSVTVYSNTVPYWEDNDESLTVSVIGTAAHNNDNSNAKMDGSVRIEGGALTYINNEITKLITEYDSSMTETTFNDKTLFNGSSYSFSSGAADVSNSIATPTFTHANLNTDTLDLTVNEASTSLTYIDTQLESLRQARSEYAAFANRLEFEIDYISDAIVTATRSVSIIQDTDMAEYTTKFVRNSFLEDAALSVHMQSRVQKRDVLTLYFSQSRVEGQSRFYF